MSEQKSDLTKAVILYPLEKALQDADINEQSIVNVLSEILYDEEQPGSTRLNAIKIFLSIVGLVNESKHLADIQVTHRISDALEDLQAKRLERTREVEYKPSELLE